GSKVALPAWLASITHVPTAVNDTVEPAIEHTEVAVASIVNVTGLPDPPPVAVTAYVAPPTTAPPGGTDVKLIVCDALAVTLIVLVAVMLRLLASAPSLACQV